MHDESTNTRYDSVNALQQISAKIEKAASKSGRSYSDITLVAVSKTFDTPEILPILKMGQRVFGENRVQEAKAKWPTLQKAFLNIQLHLIGPLQSNKAAEAIQLFDVIETINREKIAMVLAQEAKKQDKRLKFYVQVNTGLEPQKSGITPQDTVAFVRRCQTFHHLDIEGLMCIPPADENPGLHFALLEKLGREAGLSKFSMGMSRDFETAIAFGATSIRVGSAIFGHRI
ncbi:MAG: Alanine racemase domain-containing protein [Candidatus Tokpelaia sp. JSC189]|nr:MAG: Alanine racemase domain-containing protein [Candidatus Tokpelaia sp. JSC189]